MNLTYSMEQNFSALAMSLIESNLTSVDDLEYVNNNKVIILVFFREDLLEEKSYFSESQIKSKLITRV